MSIQVIVNSAKREEKRSILEKAGLKFFSVKFEKKDGTLREMTVKKWTDAAFTYGRDNALENPVNHRPEYFTAVDMAKGEFRNINLDKLKKAKINGVTYIFTE